MKHVYQRRVSFADTDAAGVVHFARLLCYAEEAEHDFLAELGIPLLENGGWPRVKISCDYLAPLRVSDEVEVSISIAKVGKSSLQWIFSMSCCDLEVAQGEMKTVRVDAEGKSEIINDVWRKVLFNCSLEKEDDVS
ncbi:MAG: acyl-CoA thioesterase [Akkermansiaceae bacterium]